MLARAAITLETERAKRPNTWCLWWWWWWFISAEVTGARNFSTLTYPAYEQCYLLSIVGGPFFQICNLQNLKITRIITFRISNVGYQAGSWWDPKYVFNLCFFERTLYKSNYIISILSWCRTHTKIRSKLVDIITAGSQKITLWGSQRTPLGI